MNDRILGVFLIVIPVLIIMGTITKVSGWEVAKEIFLGLILLIVMIALMAMIGSGIFLVCQ